MFWNDSPVSVGLHTRFTINSLSGLMGQTETLLADKIDEDLQIERKIDEEIAGEYEKLTDGIDDEDVKAEVHAQLRKREEARVLKERAERKKMIQDKAKAITQILEGKESTAQATETAPDHEIVISADGDESSGAEEASTEDSTAQAIETAPGHQTALSDYSALRADGEERIPRGGMLISEAATETENITGSLQHPPDNGSASEQQQLTTLTTPEEVLVSAAVGLYAAKLLRGIEVIKKLRAENSEFCVERSALMAEIESLKRNATEQCAQHQVVQAELSELKTALRERDNETALERELGCESWARAVFQLQTRNDCLTETLTSGNTRASAALARASAAQARQAKLETELLSWRRYFEMRSFRTDISGPERAHCASAVCTTQNVLWPEIEAAPPSSASSVTDGADTPSTVTTEYIIKNYLCQLLYTSSPSVSFWLLPHDYSY